MLAKILRFWLAFCEGLLWGLPQTVFEFSFCKVADLHPFCAALGRSVAFSVACVLLTPRDSAEIGQIC